jgi:hypothetical protein
MRGIDVGGWGAYRGVSSHGPGLANTNLSQRFGTLSSPILGRRMTMNPTAILIPVLALVGLTFTVLTLIPYQRFRAISARQVTVGDFRYGESPNVPGRVSLPNRNMMNLLEMPVLFYVVCLVAYVSGHVDALIVNLAWAFVALRVVHSLVHLSYNDVQHRLVAFTLSNFVIVAMWLRLLLQLSA